MTSSTLMRKEVESVDELNAVVEIMFQSKVKRILVLDDNRGTASQVRSDLADNDNYRIIDFSDELKPIDFFIVSKPDLVILDLSAKKRNQYKVSRVIKSLAIHNIPYIILCEEDECEQAVGYVYQSISMAKPVEPNSLKRVINKTFYDMIYNSLQEEVAA